MRKVLKIIGDDLTDKNKCDVAHTLLYFAASFFLDAADAPIELTERLKEVGHEAMWQYYETFRTQRN